MTNHITKKKLKSGFSIPTIGFGTYLVGGHREPDYSDDNKWIKIVKKVISLGYTHIDTAEVYGGWGHAEELIGQAIKGYDRKKLFITTKVDPSNLKYEKVIQSAKNSLQRLNTTYIDLYLIHFPNPNINIKETIKALDSLVEQGLVKNIGVSNFNIVQLKEAQKHSKNKIVANQVRYNLWSKEVDLETIKYCQENDIIVIAHKPFQRGRINEEKIEILSKLAKKYNKTESQIVINWLISKKNVVTLFKSGSIKHIKENKEVFDFTLTKKEQEELDKIVENNQK
ncbi:MAG: aldo/keto reductase [Nanoarchaeota archaeon]